MPNSLKNIFITLGLNKSNGLYITSENKWKNLFSKRIEEYFETEFCPDAFFCIDKKPFILFYNNPQNENEIFKAVWCFNEAPVIIINKKNIIEIYNGFSYIKENSALEKLGDNNILSDFEYFNLVTGETWEKYNKQFAYENRVDYHLLENIKAARKIILDNSHISPTVANNLIGKCIFVRYLIDRHVRIGFGNELKEWSVDDFCEILKSKTQTKKFFGYLQEKFNGNLFPISELDFKSITPQVLEILIHLISGSTIGDKDIQYSLFDIYDFSIIPVEFISNVYELFIGQDEQAKKGAYYTPVFLVEYILSQTIEKYFNDNPNIYNCKILDPACGSGIFLVEALRKIIKQFESLHPEVKDNPQKHKEALIQLTEDNIYGIDKDPSAIHVAVFSIYLTMLHYQSPRDIENFKFPDLAKTNFFSNDFFDTDADYNTVFQSLELDFIVGNPPWKGNALDEVGVSYLKKRNDYEKQQNKKYEIAVNNGEIAEGFILRVSDFSNENTQIALIVRSTILYNLGYKTDFSPFRQYWLEEYFIEQVFELAPVRKEVFNKSHDPAIAPAVVLFYKYANGQNTDNNILTHITLKPSRFFSLFKIFTINRNDYKKIKQKQLKDYDWLWKTVVYGSYLDFHFIKRLRKDYLSVKDIVSDKEKFIEGTGIQYSSNPTYTSKHLINKPLIDSFGVEPFLIIPEKITKFNKEKVHRIRDERLFKAPMLLVREGLDLNELKAKSVISQKDILFKDSITSIKAVQQKFNNYLLQINALFSSNIYSYLAINTFSSIGIERERAKNYNKFSIPFVECDVEPIINKIEKLKKKLHEKKQSSFFIPINEIKKLENSINTLLKQLDKEVLKKFNLNEEEQALINYALYINRPIIIKNKKNKSIIQEIFSPIDFKDTYLEEYASLYLTRFKPNMDNEKQKFIVEIWHTHHVIGMLFKVVTDLSENDIIWNDSKDNQHIIKFLTKLSSEKITERLFIQKDIRGFEKDYFYVFKPNEKRLWHKAIGYLDVEEFMDAILRAGKDGK